MYFKPNYKYEVPFIHDHEIIKNSISGIVQPVIDYYEIIIGDRKQKRGLTYRRRNYDRFLKNAF